MGLNIRRELTFCDATTASFTGEKTSEKLAQKFYTDDVSLTRWHFWLAMPCGKLLQPIRGQEPHRSGQWRVISMEFLCLLLRCHFAGKSVVASQMSTVCSGCSLLRSYFGLITKCYCVPPQGKGRRVAWRNKNGFVGLIPTLHQSSFMCNLKITNGNNWCYSTYLSEWPFRKILYKVF